MLGTGIFVVPAPAAARAGAWLPVSLLLAAAVATCNATSSAQLAAVHPEAGGAYAYGRHRLGETWGAVAGYAFVLGKTASCAAAALAVGTYAWPSAPRPVALVVLAVVTAANLAGVRKTAAVTRVLVGLTLLTLGIAVAVALLGGPAAASPPPGPAVGPGGVLGAAGLLFFAFAGYARIATLGEEVRNPARIIPRAVLLALSLTLLIYLTVVATLLHTLGVSRLASSVRPLADAVAASPTSPAWAESLVRAGATVAATGVLVALLAGVGRTVFAMAAGGDLPGALGAVSPRTHVPARAELAVAAATALVVMIGGLVGALAFSAFTVLLYYAVANAAALRLRPLERRWPRALAVAGLGGCLLLALTLPPATVLAGLAGLAGLLAVRAGRHRMG